MRAGRLMSASMVAMAPDANPLSSAAAAGDGHGDDPDDAAALHRYAVALAAAMAEAIPRWIERSVLDRIRAQRGAVTDAERAAASEAGTRARAEAAPALDRLLGADIDAQTTTPLSIARAQVRWATQALQDAAIVPATRDAFALRQDPEDLYDLVPGSFADIDPALAEPGLYWGAAKAHMHLARRRRGDQA